MEPEGRTNGPTLPGMASKAPGKALLRSSRLGPPTRFQTAVLASLALLLSPIYLVLAAGCGVPGLHLRWKCARLGLRLLFRRRAEIDLKTIFLILFYPLDSTRHFELDFAWRALDSASIRNYLDVSSPRLLFTLLLSRHRQLRADLINPDKADLAETERLLRAAGLLDRCELHNCLIAESNLVRASFDCISSVSVVEHIPEDRQAIQTMWDLLRPGGRLLLSVPCAASTSEQYIDRDEYGIHGESLAGCVFWQRFYDAQLLQERIFSVTGSPRRIEIFGERRPGLFMKMAARKRQDRYYPFWREPYLTAREYARFRTVDELPGEGVCAMEFIKK